MLHPKRAGSKVLSDVVRDERGGEREVINEERKRKEEKDREENQI